MGAAYIAVVTFNVAAGSYARFMGRFAEPLAPQFADFAGVRAGQRALDVGSGPGALTAHLVESLGAGAGVGDRPVGFLRRCAPCSLPRRLDVRSGVAEQLPFGAGGFDVTLAQLVVHFMTDPVAGLAEMARVTRLGATCGRRLRLGSRRRHKSARHVLAGCTRPRRSCARRGGICLAPERVSSLLSCAKRRGCSASSHRHRRSRSGSRRLPTGGSRSCSASGLPERTLPSWRTTSASCCELKVRAAVASGPVRHQCLRLVRAGASLAGLNATPQPDCRPRCLACWCPARATPGRSLDGRC